MISERALDVKLLETVQNVRMHWQFTWENVKGALKALDIPGAALHLYLVTCAPRNHSNFAFFLSEMYAVTFDHTSNVTAKLGVLI